LGGEQRLHDECGFADVRYLRSELLRFIENFASRRVQACGKETSTRHRENLHQSLKDFKDVGGADSRGGYSVN
jgi:hypothetical protein